MAEVSRQASLSAASLRHRCKLRRLLLVEPQYLLRRTIALTAQELETADIVEAGCFESAAQMLRQSPFDALVLGLGENLEGLELLNGIRAGETLSCPDIPACVMTSFCDVNTVDLLQSKLIRRIILRPFKVKTVLETMARL